MLPVFSNPLGLRKLNLVTESTENARIASARLVLFEFGLPLDTNPLAPGESEEVDELAPCFRTRSAHDFGETLAGGELLG